VQAAQDVTGKARDEGHELKDRAAHAVRKAAGAVTDTADEAASSAQASGQAVRDQVKGGAGAAKDKAQAARQWAAEKSEQTKEWAADKNEEAKQQVQDVKEWVHDSASEAQAKAASAGEAGKLQGCGDWLLMLTSIIQMVPWAYHYHARTVVLVAGKNKNKLHMQHACCSGGRLLAACWLPMLVLFMPLISAWHLPALM
jgi:hypothetical protein